MRPDNGFFGEFGGQFVPETLIPAIDELEAAFQRFRNDENSLGELKKYREEYTGRPTPVYFAENLSRKYGVNIYLKREDLLHTGAHKINNAIGQGMLARHMGKTRVIAETGAGQHGVATATAAAMFGLDCTVYMGRVDARRQKPNVQKMKLLGAEVVLVTDGQETLKDAVSAALRDWVSNVQNTHYIIGSVVGPHPFPEIVAFFHAVIGEESAEYFRKKDFLPDFVLACVGGGSNAIGIFQGFLDTDVRLIGVEAGGRSLDPGENSATLTKGKKGIFQGTLSYLLQNEKMQMQDVHSVSAGLDYPGVGPQHSFLHDTGRVEYVHIFDDSALNSFKELTRLEGIIPALESSHALAYVLDSSDRFKGKNVLVNLSGRGDKDFPIIEKYLAEEL